MSRTDGGGDLAAGLGLHQGLVEQRLGVAHGALGGAGDQRQASVSIRTSSRSHPPQLLRPPLLVCSVARLVIQQPQPQLRRLPQHQLLTSSVVWEEMPHQAQHLERPPQALLYRHRVYLDLSLRLVELHNLLHLLLRQLLLLPRLLPKQRVINSRPTPQALVLRQQVPTPNQHV